jgi:hypothetical protein
MNRQDILGFLGSLMLFSMAYLDPGWRWFWALAGGVILVWSLYTTFIGDEDDPTLPLR